MRRMLLLCAAIVLIAGSLIAQPPVVTIHDIQYCAPESLHVLDSLGYITTSQWTMQRSAYNNDTVTVVALVVIPTGEITYTVGPMTLAIYDTGSLGYGPWSGILVRYPSDSASADADGMFNLETGDIVQITGVISEFPTPSSSSFTQFAPIAGIHMDILSSGNPIPPPVELPISEFNVGANPGGKPMYTTGEQWEAKEIFFTNVTVGGNVNTSRGTFFFADTSGNQLSDYDWSYHFSLGHGSTYPVAGDPNYKVPPAGAKIDTIRGFISTASGGEAVRGYRIAPIYPGDVIYSGKLGPGINTHRRYPVVVAKDTLPLISVKAFRQIAGGLATYDIDSVRIFYSVDDGPWNSVTMTAAQPSVDSTYTGRIPAEPVGSTVRYFVKATDLDTLETILANSGFLSQLDSSKGFFFYKVIDRAAQPLLTIRDIQTTPYINGRSPYVGAIDSTGGIVTADSAHMRLSPLAAFGTNAYYIQSGTQPFSGLWVVGPDSILAKIVNGDSVVVAGTIAENSDVTRMELTTSARIISHGNTVPSPVKISTENFGPNAANGNLAAEPWESMLVEFDSVTVTDLAPVFELPDYSVQNGAAPTLVREDGKNSYTPDSTASPLEYTIIHVGDKIEKLIGVIYYGNNRYKLEPRTNDDFVGYQTGVRSEYVPVATRYELSQNFPNPFNPTTTIRYSITGREHVVLKIYNLLGQEVASLVNDDQPIGTYSVQFDASHLASGVYFYRLSAGNFVSTRKLLLLK